MCEHLYLSPWRFKNRTIKFLYNKKSVRLIIGRVYRLLERRSSFYYVYGQRGCLRSTNQTQPPVWAWMSLKASDRLGDLYTAETLSVWYLVDEYFDWSRLYGHVEENLTVNYNYIYIVVGWRKMFCRSLVFQILK